MSEISEAQRRLFYVVDFRPEWRTRPCITFWRPNSAGYAYPLPWSGQYDLASLKPGYHEKREGRKFIRFAVPCSVADGLATAPPAKLIDGDAGPVVMNTATNRQALRKARHSIACRKALGETE